MKLVCPKCGYFKEVDTSGFKPGLKSATCPRCENKFTFEWKRDSDLVAPSETEIRPSENHEFAEKETAHKNSSKPAAKTLRRSLPEKLDMQSGKVPWEGSSLSWPRALGLTMAMVIVKPIKFFSILRITENIRRPLLFAVICQSLGIIFWAVWNVIFLYFPSLNPFITGLQELPLINRKMLLTGTFTVLILSPVLAVVWIYVAAFFAHIFLKIVAAADKGFIATFRVTAYASVSALANIIPYFGWLAAGIWCLFLYLVGFPKAHDTGRVRVLVGMLVIPVIFGVLFIMGLVLITLGIMGLAA